MSKKANPTLVGGFVIGAVALVVAGILIFGGGGFLQTDFKYVAHFESAVTGLDVGAPVRFQGVQIGRVSRIAAVWAADENDHILIPVELTFRRDAVETPSERFREQLEVRGVEAVMSSLIKKGMRAVLVQDSFVTGKLHVALQLHPDSEEHLVGGSQLPEIPTLTVGMERVAKTIEDRIDELVQGAIEAMDSVKALATKPAFDEVLGKLDALITRADQHVDPLSTSIQALVEDLRAVSKDLSRLTQNLDAQLGPLAGEATGALSEARETLVRVNGVIGEDHVLVYRVATMLEELTEAARALRVLADTLERQPESILSGKGNR